MTRPARTTPCFWPITGPVVAGKGLDAAVYAAEELEETAKLHLLLRGAPVRLLTDEQVTELREAFPT